MKAKALQVSDKKEFRGRNGPWYVLKADVEADGDRLEGISVICFSKADLAAFEGGEEVNLEEREGRYGVEYVVRGVAKSKSRGASRRDDSARDDQIARMNSLGHAVQLVCAGVIRPEQLFLFAEDAFAWITTGQRVHAPKPAAKPAENIEDHKPDQTVDKDSDVPF